MNVSNYYSVYFIYIDIDIDIRISSSKILSRFYKFNAKISIYALSLILSTSFDKFKHAPDQILLIKMLLNFHILHIYPNLHTAVL